MLEAPDWAPHGEPVLHQLDRKFEEKTWQEPIIIGLAIAVVIGIGIVCLKNKLK